MSVVQSENGVVDLLDLAEEDDVICLTEVQENKLLTDQVRNNLSTRFHCCSTCHSFGVNTWEHFLLVSRQT